MSLQEKIIKLKQDTALADLHVKFWERQIAVHGEAKATDFYKHLGFNHLSTKAEFDGLQLRREPRDSEKLCVKGVATAQNEAQGHLSAILLDLRASLVRDGLQAIVALAPADYHRLTLETDNAHRLRLRKQLLSAYKQGRSLVAVELKTKAVDGEEDFGELDTLVDVTDARVANDVQARIIAATARYTALGLIGDALIKAVSDDINTGSTTYIDRTATGLANRTLSIGRSDEAATHDIERVEYSALLDNNVCEFCAPHDGETATSEDDLAPAPNPECIGGDFCRCFFVYITS